jgi:hypothetical protein
MNPNINPSSTSGLGYPSGQALAYQSSTGEEEFKIDPITQMIVYADHNTTSGRLTTPQDQSARTQIVQVNTA